MNPEEALSEYVAPQFEKPLIWPQGKSAAIAYADNVFADSFCQTIIDHCLENNDRSFRGKTMGGINLSVKSSIDWHLEHAQDAPINKEQELDKRIFDQLWRVIRLYQHSIPQLKDAGNVEKAAVGDSGYQVQLYKKHEGFYDEHIDGAPWIESTRARTLGIVIYLNAVEVGGGTYFPMHNLTIDARQGRVALFPAHWTHPHSGVMPMSGDKWIISTFINCNT